MKTRTYVTYDTPGIIVPESGTREVPDRNPAREARELPGDAYAFRYHDIITATAPQGPELRSEPLNISNRYYIDAEKLTAADVEQLPEPSEILLENMHCNRWDYVLRCRAGNFQPPLEPGDEIVSSTAPDLTRKGTRP